MREPVRVAGRAEFALSSFGAPRLTPANSRTFRDLVWAVVGCESSIHKLVGLGNIPRATFYRWMSPCPPRIPIAGAESIVAELEECFEVSEALRLLRELIRTARRERETELRSMLREHGISVARSLTLLRSLDMLSSR